MAKILIFYHSVLLAVSEGDAHAKATLADIKATRGTFSRSGDNAYLRDVSVFDGVPEHGVDKLLFLGRDDDNAAEFERVVEAYAPYDIAHEDIALLDEEAPSENSSSSEPASGMAALMAEATELGLHFSPQIGEATLRGRVENEKAKRAAEAAKAEGEGKGGNS